MYSDPNHKNINKIICNRLNRCTYLYITPNLTFWIGHWIDAFRLVALWGLKGKGIIYRRFIGWPKSFAQSFSRPVEIWISEAFSRWFSICIILSSGAKTHIPSGGYLVVDPRIVGDFSLFIRPRNGPTEKVLLSPFNTELSPWLTPLSPSRFATFQNSVVALKLHVSF